jgi:hypothetical protein
MMKRRGYGKAAAVLGVMCAIGAISSLSLAADAPPGAAKAPVTEARVVKVYEPGTLAPTDYAVIDHLWVSRWRTAFDVPRHRDQASAQQALLNEAARMGGDGVVNMHCLQSAVVLVRWGQHYCYGNVIRLK